jgi:1-acyl-sn-glycerol-3-phosphate acyltransferase
VKKKKNYKKPNLFIYGIYKFICKILAKFKFNLKVTRNELKGNKGPYVIIANHEAAIDFINIAATVKKAHFVISYSFYHSLPIQPLIKAAGVIPKQQFQTSTADMKAMKTVLENDMPFVIYPAGLMSENGVSTPIPPSTGKFLKWLGHDVYVAKTTGSYLTSPKWSKIKRKGRINLDIYKLYDKDELKSLSNDELYKKVIEVLYYDAYENQEKQLVEYKNGSNIEGIENVLYKCPKCGNEFTNVVKDSNTMICNCCNNQAKANKYGFLEKVNDSDVVYKHPSDWASSIEDELYNHIKENPDYTLEDECEIKMIDYKKHKFVPVGKGYVKYTKDLLTLTGTVNGEELSKTFKLNQYPILPFKPNAYFEIQENNDIYRICLKNSNMTTKWVYSIKSSFKINNNL